MGGYLAAGVALALSPVGWAEIEKQVAVVRGNPIANAITGREAPPEWKVMAFRVLLVLAVVLLWPILLVSWLQDRSRERKEQRAWEARVTQGLEYDRMGGVGEIWCQDCGFRQEITSFTHGYSDGGERCCTTGYQCLECGKFHAVDQEGSAPSAVPRCGCGGELSREHFLFCPECRSTKLRYGMSYIT
jgi:hypothetical protein